MRAALIFGLSLALAAPLRAEPPQTIAESARQLATLRPVAVLVESDRIAPSIEVGRVARDPSGGGLLDSLIIGSMDNKADVLAGNAFERASLTIRPLADALEAFRIADLALATTRSALSSTAWTGTGPAALIGDDSGDLAAYAAAHPAEQLWLARYSYRMSHDFTQVQVIADIDLLDAKKLAPLYRQRIVSAVRLNRRSYEADENVARWAADDSALARKALADAMGRLETVIPAVLALDPAQFAVVTDRKKREQAVAADFHGPLLLRDSAGPVIWSKGTGFVAMQSAGD